MMHDGKKIPASLCKYSKIWLLLRGLTMLLTISIERNGLTFNNTRLDARKVKPMFGKALFTVLESPGENLLKT